MPRLRDVASLRPLMDLFPLRNEISFCFAYGSAVFEQSLQPLRVGDHRDDGGAEKAVAEKKPELADRKMIDLVVAVDNPLEWHRENLERNQSHYSGLRHLGPGWISKIQQHFGAKIFYNTLIPVGDDYIKYGVISTRDLINDLLDWETFYISGRLHKPTLTLHRQGDNTELISALKMNMQSAIHVALLLLPEQFTEEELYMTIAGLSYSGDFRMTFGEDKNKVAKIVRPQMESFRALYQPLLRSDLLKDLVHWSATGNCFEQNCSQKAIQWHLNLLPKNVQVHLSKVWLASNSHSSRLRVSASHLDLDDLMRRLAFDLTYRGYLKSAISTIVYNSSWRQSVKGIFTAGLSKSFSYSMDKISKMIRGSGQAAKKNI